MPGLLLAGTLVVRLELERLVNSMVRLVGHAGGARPGPQGADVGARHGGRRLPHRSR
jgi:hypothetical protein